jgi:hypothetical protein
MKDQPHPPEREPELLQPESDRLYGPEELDGLVSRLVDERGESLDFVETATYHSLKRRGGSARLYKQFDGRLSFAGVPATPPAPPPPKATAAEAGAFLERHLGAKPERIETPNGIEYRYRIPLRRPTVRARARARRPRVRHSGPRRRAATTGSSASSADPPGEPPPDLARACATCNRPCGPNERTCTRCRQRRSRERRHQAEPQAPLEANACRCGAQSLGSPDEDGQIGCLACGRPVQAGPWPINGFDRHRWLMETGADGLPYPQPRRELPARWRDYVPVTPVTVRETAV